MRYLVVVLAVLACVAQAAAKERVVAHLANPQVLQKELAPGRFRARLPIPRGGVRSIVIGLVGWRTDSRGSRRSDWRFPIDNDPTR